MKSASLGRTRATRRRNDARVGGRSGVTGAWTLTGLIARASTSGCARGAGAFSEKYFCASKMYNIPDETPVFAVDREPVAGTPVESPPFLPELLYLLV